MEAGKRQKWIAWILGAAAGAVLIGAAATRSREIVNWIDGLLPRSEQTPPPIDAVVEAVKLEDELVVLSVGQDQKVRAGYEFTIYRGDKFIGEVKVTKVYENLCSARILFTNESETIRIGDKAATQI